MPGSVSTMRIRQPSGPYSGKVMSKYHAKKTEADGIIFDSKKEAARYEVLKILQKTGLISDLRLQVPYVLIAEQRGPDEITARGRRKKGKLWERACVYVADFVYTDTETGETVVEDVKGRRTKEYIIKRKLMLKEYGIRIKEV